MAQRLFTLTITLTAAFAFAYRDIPLVVTPIDDNGVPIEPALPPINTPEPLLLPIIKNCEQFHLVKPGETCDSIATSLGMTVQELGTLNPFIGKDGKECARGLLAGYWCCVKARGMAPAIPNQPIQVTGPLKSPQKFGTRARGKTESEGPKRTSRRATTTKTATKLPESKPTRVVARPKNPNYNMTECKWENENCPEWEWVTVA